VSCPTDVFKPATTVCRPDAGDCDVEETCTGSSVDCPAEVFESDGWSEARKYLKIEKVPASAIREEVVDDSVCQALYRATEKALPKVFDIKPEQAHFFFESKRLFYFRIGDYYAVLPLSNQPVRGYADLFIFRGDDLKYVGSVLM